MEENVCGGKQVGDLPKSVGPRSRAHTGVISLGLPSPPSLATMSGNAYGTKAADTDFRKKWDKEEYAEKAKKKDEEERERMKENEERLKQGAWTRQLTCCHFLTVYRKETSQGTQG